MEVESLFEPAQNPTVESVTHGGLNITQLSPGDQRLTLAYSFSGNADSIRATADALDGTWTAELTQSSAAEGRFTFGGLQNQQNYKVRLTAIKGCAIVGISAVRLFRPGPVPGVVVNYIHPEDYTFNSSGRSPASPSILRLDSGALLVSHDIFWGGGGQNLTHLFRSDDGGASWRFVSEIYPCFWGSLFVHRGRLYIMGTSCEYGALNLFCSDDEGATWSSPTAILPQGSREAGGPHKASMPVLVHEGRLWTGIDFGSWKLGGHASGAVSAAEDADLMNPASWSCTGFTQAQAYWPGAPAGDARGTLEGNMVAGRDGEVYNILRYQHDNCTPGYGKAVVLRVDKRNPDNLPQFDRIIDFPGNLTKFAIRFDPATQRYYTLVNNVTSDNLKQRNVLTLMSSEDMYHWTMRRGILNYEDNNYWEDSTKVGFQYVDFVFDGEDIVFASRTAINGAYNYHNANHVTAHRIYNYSR